MQTLVKISAALKVIYPLQIRSLHSSSIRRETTSFTDPTCEGLFYHLQQPPNALSSSFASYALSFLPTPPRTPESPTIIGWLPAEAPGVDGMEAGLNDFKENPRFVNVLHQAIQKALADDADDIIRNGALQLQNGWMHIHDSRNLPPLGRIGDPDDIMATVLVENSQIRPETYQAMPSYRVCTSDGITELTLGIKETLQKILQEIAKAENKST